MEKEKPLILVSNDDGVMAKGINELVKFLRPLGEIIVMAPDAPRSGSGCALTVTQPVHLLASPCAIMHPMLILKLPDLISAASLP